MKFVFHISTAYIGAKCEVQFQFRYDLSQLPEGVRLVVRTVPTRGSGKLIMQDGAIILMSKEVS